MRKGLWLVVAALALALTGPQAAWASDAASVIAANYTGEEVAFTVNFTNGDLSWIYTPDPGVNTLAAAVARAPIPWTFGLDLGAPLILGDEKFAVITGVAAGGTIVTHEGTLLDDVTGADALAFADFISGGLEVYGVGQVRTVSGVTSAVEKNFSTVSNPGSDIASQMTFVLRGLPITAVLGGPFIGTVSTLLGPGGELKFIEDHDLDFDPRDPPLGPGIPLTTAEFVQATGVYHAGAANDEDEKAANDPGDPEQSDFLTFSYSPTLSDSLSLVDTWDLAGALFDTAYKVTIGGVKYYLQGAASFVNLGRPFLVTGGTGAGLFAPGTRFDISGELLFGFDPSLPANAQFANPDDPSTFTFVTGPGVGAHPQLKGGPVIPEPTTGLLLGLGMVGFAAVRRRRLVVA